MKSKITLLLSFLLFYQIIAKPKIVCSTTIIYDLAKNILKDKATVICIMPIGGDPHTYEPIPSDASKIADADLILKNGLFLEGWLDKFLLNSSKNTSIIDLSYGIEPISNSNLHSSPDPHIWMNPKYGKIMAQNIKNAIQKYDISNYDFYENNFIEYANKLDKLYENIQNKINLIPENKRVLITTHDAFRYFGNEFGLKVESAMGISTDAEVLMEDMNRLTSIITKNKISAVFIESTINPKFFEQLAQDNHISIGGKLYADSIGDSLSTGRDYISMLQSNTDVIVNGLRYNQALKSTKSQIIPLISAALFLFVWAFLWIYFKIKNHHHKNLDWNNYSIVVENLTVSYEKKTVISNINFTLESGKLYGLLGPNGAGKSTLFKSILGLINLDTGTIKLNNSNISEIRNKIAYIPQKEEIDWSFPATVFDIVLTGRLPEKKRFENYTSLDKSKAKSAILKMGLEEFSNRQIGDLSGGQQQRVFIARALCQEAELLFFDEPFVGVDVTTEKKIMSIIKKLVEDNKTVIMIHHDLSKVKEYFDNIIMINQRLIAHGKTSEVFNDENITKTYGGRLSILQATDKYVF